MASPIKDENNSASLSDNGNSSESEDSYETLDSEDDSNVLRLPQVDGVSLHHILGHYLMPGVQLPPDLSKTMLWKIVLKCMQEIPRRQQLMDVNSIDDVIAQLHRASKIVVVTGAGISVSCGIPDFRSRNGIYARLAKDFPELPEPQSLFDIQFFHIDPKPFFKFAKEIFPGKFRPSPSHYFIAALQKQGKLLRNYTQNIDTLENIAGITDLVQCHGSFLTASCTRCGLQVSCETIRQDIHDGTVPECPQCKEVMADRDDEDEMAVMKPDIVFFGEELPCEFHSQLQDDMEQADLLIVMGSSLKVRPVALVPNLIDPKVPQILINKESLRHFNFDVELLGNSDDIVEELCYRLGENWAKHVPFSGPCQSKACRFIPPNRYLFNGAEYPSDDGNSTGDETSKDFSDGHSSRSDGHCVAGVVESGGGKDSKRHVFPDGESSSNPKRSKSDN